MNMIANPSSGMPVVVKNLLIINGLMLLLKIAMGADELGRSILDIWLGLHAIGSPDFKPWQVLTHMFMHAGPNSGGGWYWHIASNMFALWMFGGPIENVMGSKRFLNYYLMCGLGAAALQMSVSYVETQATVAQLRDLGVSTFDVKRMVEASHISMAEANAVLNGIVQQHPGSDAVVKAMFWDYAGVMVGASGAIFGILIAFGMLFPNVELMLLFLPIPIKAKYFVALYGLWELFSGVRQQAGDNVAHYAHLGGLIFGFFLIRYWRKKGLL
ncbi:MAG: rhomboid family intramembrane serine protease [Flavobacteriales bacterium]|jgi:rhomboid-like protein|nr:rhomboid family intramembrane serine protease [Flavobacteriales bacterium]MCB0757171.1 rhomboid family intramembrane serine protease [Flavobacteriales bacterium]